MTLKLSDTTLYNASAAFIGSIILVATALIILLIAKNRPHYTWDRPSVRYWLLAHRLQNYLALLNIIQIIFLLIAFPIVTIDRHHFCETQLDAKACHKLTHIWNIVTACLAVFALLCAVACFAVYRFLNWQTSVFRHRALEILQVRPWSLFAAFLLLQTSALFALTASFADLFYEGPRHALVVSIIAGAFAIVLFLVGTLFTFWGIVRHHVALRSLREEARSRYFRYAPRITWGRAVEERVLYTHGRTLQRRMERDLEVLFSSIARTARERERERHRGFGVENEDDGEAVV
ncbi:MAG: hypothetical protein LQ338_002443 [Usnochroma carphineum]|nr:MAG: hypothetical protein LQ338_002443 [Usnochroma carphineum]